MTEIADPTPSYEQAEQADWMPSCTCKWSPDEHGTQRRWIYSCRAHRCNYTDDSYRHCGLPLQHKEPHGDWRY